MYFCALILLGGTCGADLKCLTCGDGSTPDSNGECSVTSCSSINKCKGICIKYSLV